MDMDTYLKTSQMDKATFIEKEINPVAGKRLQRRLVLDKISRDEGIQLNTEELKTTVAATMTQLKNEPEFKNYQKRGQVENLVNAVTLDTASRLINRDTIARLKTIATGEFKPDAAVESEVEQPVYSVGSETEPAASPVENEAEPAVSPVAAEPSPDSTSTPPAEEISPSGEESKSTEAPAAE